MHVTVAFDFKPWLPQSAAATGALAATMGFPGSFGGLATAAKHIIYWTPDREKAFKNGFRTMAEDAFNETGFGIVTLGDYDHYGVLDLIPKEDVVSPQLSITTVSAPAARADVTVHVTANDKFPRATPVWPETWGNDIYVSEQDVNVFPPRPTLGNSEYPIEGSILAASTLGFLLGGRTPIGGGSTIQRASDGAHGIRTGRRRPRICALARQRPSRDATW